MSVFVFCEFLSRGSSGPERNDKPLSACPAQTGPITLGSSNKEAPEESVQEVSRRDRMPQTSCPPALQTKADWSVANPGSLVSRMDTLAHIIMMHKKWLWIHKENPTLKAVSHAAVKLEVLSGPSPDKAYINRKRDMERRSSPLLMSFCTLMITRFVPIF